MVGEWVLVAVGEEIPRKQKRKYRVPACLLEDLEADTQRSRMHLEAHLKTGTERCLESRGPAAPAALQPTWPALC